MTVTKRMYPDTVNASHRRMAGDDTPNGMLGERVTAPRQDELGTDVAPLLVMPAFEIFQRELIEGDNAFSRLGLGGA